MGESEGDGIGKCLPAGIQTQDAQSTKSLHVAALPTRPSALYSQFCFNENCETKSQNCEIKCCNDLIYIIYFIPLWKHYYLVMWWYL